MYRHFLGFYITKVTDPPRPSPKGEGKTMRRGILRMSRRIMCVCGGMLFQELYDAVNTYRFACYHVYKILWLAPWLSSSMSYFTAASSNW